MRALLLAWRPFGFVRTHSSSRCIDALPLRLLLLLDREPRLLLLEPRGVVPLERDALAPVQLQDPARDVVEEVAVVRHGDHRPVVLAKGAPRATSTDSASRWLVGSSSRSTSGSFSRSLQSATRLRSPPEITDTGVSGDGAAQGVHRLLQPAVDVPRVEVVDLLLKRRLLLEQLVEVGVGLGKFRAHRLVLLQRALTVSAAPSSTISRTVLDGSSTGSCGEVPERDPLLRVDRAQVVGVHARDDSQEGALARRR